MKRILFLMIIFPALFLAGCGERSNVSDSNFCKALSDTVTAKYDRGLRDEALAQMLNEYPVKYASVYDKYLYYNFLSRYYLENDMPDKCVATADSCMKMFVENNALETYAKEYVHMHLEKGQGYARQEKFDDATREYFGAYKFAVKHCEPCALNEYAYQIAMSLFQQGQYETAREYFGKAFQTALTCSEEDKPYQRMQELLTNIGFCYYYSKQSDIAVQYYDSALNFVEVNAKHFELSTYHEDKAHILRNKAASMMYQQELMDKPNLDTVRRIESILLNSIDHLEKTGTGRKPFPQKLILSKVYVMLDRFTDARLLLLEVTPDENEENLYKRLDWMGRLADVDYQTGNYKQAFERLSDAKYLNDSIRDATMMTQQTDIVRDLKEKEQEYNISLLTKDKELFRGYLIGAVLIFTLLILAVIQYIRYRNNRKTIELKNQFSQQLMENQEEERRQIAQELHDNIGQHVLFLKTRLSRLDEPELVEASQEVIQLVQGLSKQLYPNQLERYGLAAAIQSLTEKASEASEVFISEDTEALPINLSREINISLFRIVQECLSNALKHAQASAIRITAELKNSNCVLIIQDNGVGFDPDILTQKAQRSFGMINLEERVKMLNGNFEIISEPGNGAKFIFSFPIPK